MTLTLHRSSRELDPAQLRPGSALVLEVAPEHALAVPDGVAIEDHLGPGERVAIDAAAMERLAAWRAARGEQLRVGGIDLGHVAEVELLAGCFLPAELISRGLAAAGARGEICAVGFEGPALAGLAGVVPAGCDLVGAPAAPPPPPGRGGRRDALVHLAERTRIPAFARGEVVCVPYWHLVGVYTTMARRRGGPRPVPAGLGLAGLQTADVVRAIVRGGWGGSSGARARARSAAGVEERLSTLAREPPPGDPVVRALDAWALTITARDAGAAPAQLEHFRKVTKRARLIVTPFDSPNEQRALLAAGRDNGVPALVVQHGYRAGLNDPDLTLSDEVAVWSSHDRDDLSAQASGRITVTGNPGAPSRLPAPSRGAAARTVVLVEYPGRLSARVGSRIGLQHVAAALRALATARPGTEVVIRPHPSDNHSDRYLGVLGDPGGGLRLTVDKATPIESLLQSADLVVGALSTATLQSAVLGLPTVFLDVSGTFRPWPFDGAPDALAVARDEHELAALLGDPPTSAAAAAEALGLRDGAAGAVLGLIDELACRPR